MHENKVLSYGTLELRGSHEYIIVTLPEPLFPMIGVLDLNDVEEEDCATYLPPEHTRCDAEMDTVSDKGTWRESDTDADTVSEDGGQDDGQGSDGEQDAGI